MKKILVMMVIAVVVAACDNNPKKVGYDAKLAAELGADDWGMKRYTLVILKTGPATILEQPVLDSIFRGHMENIGRLAEAGKLIVAGPLRENDRKYRGIFILNTTDIDEAETMMADDPAIASHIFDVEYYGWYGSAALPTYLESHKRIEKENGNR
jgi:uncharacterized protein